MLRKCPVCSCEHSGAFNLARSIARRERNASTADQQEMPSGLRQGLEVVAARPSMGSTGSLLPIGLHPFGPGADLHRRMMDMAWEPTIVWREPEASGAQLHGYPGLSVPFQRRVTTASVTIVEENTDSNGPRTADLAHQLELIARINCGMDESVCRITSNKETAEEYYPRIKIRVPKVGSHVHIVNNTSGFTVSGDGAK